MTIDLILGTAGHIDHGKTSLIRALTGAETDRLPEEKRRGITIELGFAELDVGDFRLGIVDVPGHERFVRNMLAGATGMDLAMLVIAADDSINLQTREHLEILRLLDLQAGVIALTKCDLVDRDWADLVAEEIRELVADTFLADAPIVHASSATGAGLDELRGHLEEAAQKVASQSRLDRAQAPFRLAIDRTFTIAGHGTVVTGSVGSGQASVGDELLIQPGEIQVRVRSLQNHDRQVDTVKRGQRAAMNLVGIHHNEISRGQEVCSPGHLQPGKLVSVDLQMLPSAPRPLKDRTRARLHVGTAEVLSTVRLLDGDTLAPGGQGLAQLYLSEPIVTVWNQPFVLRSESPILTIGGGRILEPNAQRLRRPDAEQLEMLGQMRVPAELERASAAVYLAGLEAWQPSDLPRIAGVEDYDTVLSELKERGDLLEIAVSPTRRIRVHRRALGRLEERVVKSLNKLHDAHPLRSTLDRKLLFNGFRYLQEQALLQAALRNLQSEGRIRFGERGISLVGRGPKLSQNEQRLLNQMVEDFSSAGFEAPTLKQYQQNVKRNQDAVPQLAALAAANGDLVEIADGYYLHADVDREARKFLAEKMTDGAGMTMSEIRESLQTSRKYAVPYCEYLDRIGFTDRQGDVRVLAKTEDAPESA